MACSALGGVWRVDVTRAGARPSAVTLRGCGQLGPACPRQAEKSPCSVARAHPRFLAPPPTRVGVLARRVSRAGVCGGLGGRRGEGGGPPDRRPRLQGRWPPSQVRARCPHPLRDPWAPQAAPRKLGKSRPSRARTCVAFRAARKGRSAQAGTAGAPCQTPRPRGTPAGDAAGAGARGPGAGGSGWIRSAVGGAAGGAAPGSALLGLRAPPPSRPRRAPSRSRPPVPPPRPPEQQLRPRPAGPRPAPPEAMDALAWLLAPLVLLCAQHHRGTR